MKINKIRVSNFLIKSETLIIYLFMLFCCFSYGKASELREDKYNLKIKKTSFKEKGFHNYTSKKLADWLYNEVQKHKKCSPETVEVIPQLNPNKLKTWVKAAKQKLKNFRGKDFSGSVHGIAYFKESFDKESLWPFMQRFMHEAQGKFNTFHDQDLSGTILDLGKLLGSSYKIPDDFIDSWFNVTTKRLSKFNAQWLINCLDGLARLEIKPSDHFMQKWYIRCQELIDDANKFAPIDYSNSLSVLSKHGFKPSENFLNLWENGATLQITNFRSRDFSTSLFAFSELDITPPQEFLKAWDSQATSQLNNFNPIELSSSMFAFGERGIKPSSAFLSAWLETATLKLKDFPPQDLVKSLYGLSQLSYIKRSFQTHWIASANSKLNDFNAQSLSLSLYSFALLKKDPGKDFLIKVRDSYIQRQSQEEDYKSAHQVFYACKYFNLEYTISKKAKKAIRDQQLLSSSLQEQVTRAIQNLFPSLPLYSEHWIEDICSPVDICIPLKKLIIEVDGPHHFIKFIHIEKLQQKPKDALKDELLMRSGWIVKRIPYIEWQEHNTVDKQKSYLESKIAIGLE
jgi:very-short-patch-repair endonuclease